MDKIIKIASTEKRKPQTNLRMLLYQLLEHTGPTLGGEVGPLEVGRVPTHENNYNQNRDYMVEFPELYQIVQRASQEEKLRHLSHSPSSSTFGANEALYYKMAQDENDPN